MSVTHHPPSPHQNSWSIKDHFLGCSLQLKAGDKVIKQLSCKILKQNTKPSLLERMGITCRITLTIAGQEKIVRIWKASVKPPIQGKTTNRTSAEEALASINKWPEFLQQNEIRFVQIQNLLSLSAKESGQVFDQAFNLSKPTVSDSGRTYFPSLLVSYKTKGKTLQITKDAQGHIGFKIIDDKGHDVTDQKIVKLLKLDTWQTDGEKAEAVKKIVDCFKNQSKSLHLSDLALSRLPPNLFEHLPWLKHLNLSGNDLESFQLSYPLPKLQVLNLCRNLLTTFDVSDKIPELKKLYLFQNLLRMSEETFDRSSFPKLETLILAGNPNKSTETRRWSNLELSQYLAGLDLKDLDQLFPYDLDAGKRQRDSLFSKIKLIAQPICWKLIYEGSLSEEDKQIIAHLHKIGQKASLQHRTWLEESREFSTRDLMSKAGEQEPQKENP